jgi:hypothetical protein
VRSTGAARQRDATEHSFSHTLETVLGDRRGAHSGGYRTCTLRPERLGVSIFWRSLELMYAIAAAGAAGCSRTATWSGRPWSARCRGGSALRLSLIGWAAVLVRHMDDAGEPWWRVAGIVSEDDYGLSRGAAPAAVLASRGMVLTSDNRQDGTQAARWVIGRGEDGFGDEAEQGQAQYCERGDQGERRLREGCHGALRVADWRSSTARRTALASMCGTKQARARREC